MKKNLTIVSCLVLLFLAGACKSQYEMLLSSVDADAKYQAAFDYYNQGKYNKAAQLFESLSVLTSGTPRDDTVQFYWGMSNYRYKDYYTAQSNFESYISRFPKSAFTERASFLRLDCLYRSTLRYELDQSNTYTTISAITDFIREYPNSEHLEECARITEELNARLNRKAFENAKIYYTMEDYKAAGVALRNVLKDNSENIYREEILYYIAMSSYKYASNSVPAKQKERFLVFRDDYLNFVGEYPESAHRAELDRLYGRLRDIEK